MQKRILLCFFLLTAITVNAQVINLRGTVSNRAGKLIPNAVVTLVGQGLKDTTGSDGAYKIYNGTPVLMPLLIPGNQTMLLNKGFLEFSLPIPSPVKVLVFDIQGNLLKKELLRNASAGFYRFNIAKVSPVAKVLIIKASIGKDDVTFRYLPLANDKYAVKATTEYSISGDNKLAKIAAVGDTLKTAATGYTTDVRAITSYDQQLNITLDSAGGGNAKPSSGCGKAKTMADSVSTSINVAGADRSYIMNIPHDYDPNHPYALWFALHGRGGSALGVARGSAGTNYGYFGMRKLANKDKSTTIFCAPEGGGGWYAGDGDVQFIRALIKKFESELCIDQSRIFCAGFSMGGSMTYALSCAMPDTFRAICMHSGGGMNGCSRPPNSTGKVPMFITHGTADGTNTWPGFGFPQIKDIAQRDGCTAMDIPSIAKPTDPSGMNPVCLDYKNCETNLPCRACIFNGSAINQGAHTPSPGPWKGNDWGEASTWVPDSTWSFFKQFY